MGKTVRLTSAATGNGVTMGADSPCNQYYITNHDSQPAYVYISTLANPIQPNTSPTGNGASAQYGVAIPPATDKVLTGPQCSNTTSVWVWATSDVNASPNLYITPGEGI